MPNGCCKGMGDPNSSWIDLTAMPSFVDNSIPVGLLKTFSQSFRANPQNILAMNAVSNNDITSVILNRDLSMEAYHIFSNKLETETKVTNQKASGRCWLFAAMNVLRLGVMKNHNLEEFEFSQAYLFWFDKLEKSNWFLENIISTLGEDLNGRLVQFILKDPVQDGGQWDMAVNLIAKYGLVPKSVFPESAHSGNSRQMNWLITVKLREFARELRLMSSNGVPMEKIRIAKDRMLGEIYNILAVTMGEPPTRFDWNFRNKDKKFHSFKELTPLIFLNDHVPNIVSNSVSLVHDPRHAYGQLYTVERLGNVMGGQPVLYINLPIEELKRVALESLKDNNSVWFGCDVGKFCNRKGGVMDLRMFDYKSAFGVELGLSKADRLCYGESTMTHAMAINGVHLEDDKPARWRIENSWGEDNGEKGFYCMTDEWFTEYVYQVVVDEKYLTNEQDKILEQEPIALPPWVLNDVVITDYVGSTWSTCLNEW
jgi:bleomycin hydrolase